MWYAQETLGVYLAPDGKNKKMIETLREKSEKWGNQIRNGNLPQTYAHKVLQTTIRKSIQYPLPALTLTQTECSHIMAPALMARLTSSQIFRKFPRQVVYGSNTEGGLGISNLYTFQGGPYCHNPGTHSL